MKGSSVNRSVLTLDERKLVNKGKIADVILTNKDQVLKDTDFKELGIRLVVSKKVKETLEQQLKEDIIFLLSYNITDYSILINIHKFSNEEYSKLMNNYRVICSTDMFYIYTFSIIDFITVFCILY